jgi:hypothetical protein
MLATAAGLLANPFVKWLGGPLLLCAVGIGGYFYGRHDMANIKDAEVMRAEQKRDTAIAVAKQWEDAYDAQAIDIKKQNDGLRALIKAAEERWARIEEGIAAIEAQEPEIIVIESNVCEDGVLEAFDALEGVIK